jgi:uncharacterized integral membrane protein
MTSPDNSTDQAAAVSGAGTDQAGAPDGQHVVRRTRMGGMWVAAALFAVVLLLLLIFILENGQQVDIAYFGAHGHLPLGVALLLAAVLGILLVIIPGAGRIIQLRRTARRHRKAHASTAPPPAAGQPPGQATRT